MGGLLPGALIGGGVGAYHESGKPEDERNYLHGILGGAGKGLGYGALIGGGAGAVGGGALGLAAGQDQNRLEEILKQQPGLLQRMFSPPSMAQ